MPPRRQIILFHTLRFFLFLDLDNVKLRCAYIQVSYTFVMFVPNNIYKVNTFLRSH